jgi:hypothetical protein
MAVGRFTPLATYAFWTERRGEVIANTLKGCLLSACPPGLASRSTSPAIGCIFRQPPRLHPVPPRAAQWPHKRVIAHPAPACCVLQRNKTDEVTLELQSLLKERTTLLQQIRDLHVSRGWGG